MEEVTIKGWVARNEKAYSGCDLQLFIDQKPKRRGTMPYWIGKIGHNITLNESLYPNLTWQDEPIEVEITIKNIE